MSLDLSKITLQQVQMVQQLPAIASEIDIARQEIIKAQEANNVALARLDQIQLFIQAAVAKKPIKLPTIFIVNASGGPPDGFRAFCQSINSTVNRVKDNVKIWPIDHSNAISGTGFTPGRGTDSHNNFFDQHPLMELISELKSKHRDNAQLGQFMIILYDESGKNRVEEMGKMYSRLSRFFGATHELAKSRADEVRPLIDTPILFALRLPQQPKPLTLRLRSDFFVGVDGSGNPDTSNRFIFFSDPSNPIPGHPINKPTLDQALAQVLK